MPLTSSRFSPSIESRISLAPGMFFRLHFEPPPAQLCSQYPRQINCQINKHMCVGPTVMPKCYRWNSLIHFSSSQCNQSMDVRLFNPPTLDSTGSARRSQWCSTEWTTHFRGSLRGRRQGLRNFYWSKLLAFFVYAKELFIFVQTTII